MNNRRSFSLVRICCVAVLLILVGLPAESAATNRTRSSVVRTPGSQKLSLSKKKVTPKRTRRVSASRARASVRARQLQEAIKPRFKFDDTGALVPDIRAEAAIIYDPKTGQVLWEQNSLDQRSIASITKVMTATVILEDPNDWSTHCSRIASRNSSASASA